MTYEYRPSGCAGGALLIKKPAGSNQAAPAALVNFRLLLLPSGPDKIHGMTPHGTQSSSPTD